MNRNVILVVLAILAASALLYALMAGEQGDYTKVLVINLHIGRDGITSPSAQIMYGHPPAAGLRTGPLRGRLLDKGGDPVRDFAVWDPRVQFGDRITGTGPESDVLEGVMAVSEEADLLLILPYTGKEEQFLLSDAATGRRLATVELAGAAAAFSQTYPDDPAAAGPDRHVPLPVIVGGCVLAILFIAVIYMMVRRR